jgi:hypothetical protein
MIVVTMEAQDALVLHDWLEAAMNAVGECPYCYARQQCGKFSPHLSHCEIGVAMKHYRTLKEWTI